jgi:hypothetical protein
MKKIHLPLAAALLFCAALPAQAGVRFGIPLPFPFLVWTPSSHCGQGNHGRCGPRGQDSTTAAPKAATNPTRATAAHARPEGAAKAAS